ncbi:hypothetical protein SLE2022_233960 [Rubroshorea leprosula]
MVALYIVSCLLRPFIDSFRDKRGKVRYRVAMFKGLWVVAGFMKLSAKEKEKYKLRFIDFFHAFVFVLVFVAIALFDQNVAKCSISKPSEKVKQLIAALIVAIGVVCSVLFVAFLTRWHGVDALLFRN